MKTKTSGRKFFYAGCTTATIVLIVILSLLFSIHAESKTRTAALFDNSAYEEKETAYETALRRVLSDAGCTNSGITLTHVVSLDGDRSYQVIIHNASFDYMTQDDKAALIENLGRCVIADTMENAFPVEVVVAGSDK